MKKTLLKLAVMAAALTAAVSVAIYGFRSFTENPSVESVSAASGVAPETLVLYLLGGVALLVLASWNTDPHSRRRRRYSYTARRRR